MQGASGSMLPTIAGPARATASPGAPSLPGFVSPALVPPWLPGQHFLAALVFYAVGASTLVLAAPDLSRGHFFVPRVVALVHLFTLGWIVLSIFGALCQFLPVAVGRSVRFPPLAHLSFAAQTLGVGSFVVALLASSRPLLLFGAFALSLAFAAFAVNLAATLIPVRERNLTWWALAGAAIFLLATPAYGVVLALNLRDGALLSDRFGTIGQHAHIAILGFVLMVMVGVAHRLLPMFLLTHGASERPAWVAIGLLFGSATLLSMPWGGSARLSAAAALGSAGVLALLVQAATFFKHRKRRAIDPGMRLVASGLAGLGLAVVLAPFALTRGLADPRLLTTYFVVLLGAVTLFVAGHYYKIVPFLVWNHRYGPLLGKRKVPKVSELYSERVALADAALLVAGLVGLAVATFIGSVVLARMAAIVFAAGAWLQVIVITRLAQRKLA
ncbi:MAG: hypothetical protein HS104_30445 [Polyangiaceae bacterium]|nr:hypothetical protein [Polyangiaceae bacterium]MCE7889159.1 hypothetical protein [Sorangiineae bacterium PRO1]MCL4755624.1 hypothetical protein [Myxococcales bacterium]